MEARLCLHGIKVALSCQRLSFALAVPISKVSRLRAQPAVMAPHRCPPAPLPQLNWFCKLSGKLIVQNKCIQAAQSQVHSAGVRGGIR